jgi:hypothetical protein
MHRARQVVLFLARALISVEKLVRALKFLPAITVQMAMTAFTSAQQEHSRVQVLANAQNVHPVVLRRAPGPHLVPNAIQASMRRHSDR